MSGVLRILMSLVFLFVFSAQVFAVTNLDDMTVKTPLIVATELMPGATVSNVIFLGATRAAGTFKTGLPDGIGIDQGFLFTTGAIVNAVGPNLAGGFGVPNNLPGDPALDALVAPASTLDATVLEFDFTILDPLQNAITFRLVFASDEYNENVNDPTGLGNDVFALFLDGVNIATIPGTANPLTVNNLNGTATPALFNGNDPVTLGLPTPFQTQYDGFSRLLTITVTVNPAVTHHLKLAIADTTDANIDSAVFMAPATFAAGGLAATPSGIGIFRNGAWFMDNNGNKLWDGCGPDGCMTAFGGPGDIPVAGDWSGLDGIPKIGVYRDGSWFLDSNGNGIWDGCTIDKCVDSFGGAPGDMPVVGDWTGVDGIAKIGIFRDGAWFLDLNNNGIWDGCTIDKCVDSFGGLAEDIPVVGDWAGVDGIAKIGIFRNGAWFLDNDNSGTWDGCTIDKCVDSFGGPGDKPVIGDWNGDGIAKIGIFRNGAWFLDNNNSGTWDGCLTDACVDAFGGLSADMPIVK